MAKAKELGLGIALFFCLTASAIAQGPCTEWFSEGHPRWEEPQDTAMAMLEPDCYAWRLFIALNWPANPATRMADSSAVFGSGGPVVWETWRNARNDAPDTAFPLGAADPGPWLGVPVPVATAERFDTVDDVPVQLAELQRLLEAAGGGGILFDPQSAGTLVNETRLNKETYEFVRSMKLYDRDAQIALFNAGVFTITFPLNAKEIKAQWRVISDNDKPRYYWIEAATDVFPDGKVFGLTSLHITTKDLPNWFWTTFEHVDNKNPAPEDDDHPMAFGWQRASRDSFACAEAPYDCNRAPPDIGLEGTVWENYRLRGTQIDFVDIFGRPTLLANSQPEGPFQATSSCISCHARSTINGFGQRLPFFTPDFQGFVGVPTGLADPLTGSILFTQLDFVFSLRRAQ